MADASKTTSYRPGVIWNSPGGRLGMPRPVYPCDPSCQPCPDCGGLECLCRPRFFAGQLLTEQDLNRLDDYIKAKNRLHNRYLWGPGVVCGLEVRCHPCGDAVSVSPGYALSPCGDDIIVCKTDVVDVCKLINKCRTTPMPDCRPYSGDTSGCDDLIENWILAIRYEEKPARGITALTGASQGCCACGRTNCTSTTVGGCGCAGMPWTPSAGSGATTATSASSPQPSRAAPPACEPTLTCEGYRYEVYRAAADQQPVNWQNVTGIAALLGALNGHLPQRLSCCLQNLYALMPAPPQNVTSYNQDVYQWLCGVKQAAIDYFVRYGGYDCQAAYQLQAIVFPDPNSSPSEQSIADALIALLAILFGEFIDCICSAALPPCPDPGDPRVALASISVRRSDCTIVSVCDWAPARKHVVTFRNLAYWFGWLPFTGLIREFMNFLCCELLGLLDLAGGLPAAGTAAGAAPAPAAATGAPAPAPDPLARPIRLKVGNYAPNSPAGNVALALIGNLQNQPQNLTLRDLVDAIVQPVTVGTGAPTAQPQEVAALAATPAMKTFTEILRPLTASIPPGLLQIFGGGPSGGSGSDARPAGTPTTPTPPTPPTAAVPSPDVDELRTRLTQLQQTVAEQQAQIDALRNPPPRSRR